MLCQTLENGLAHPLCLFDSFCVSVCNCSLTCMLRCTSVGSRYGLYWCMVTVIPFIVVYRQCHITIMFGYVTFDYNIVGKLTLLEHRTIHQTFNCY